MAEKSIIQIILEAIDKNTGPVVKGATDNVSKLGTATKLTAEEQKKLAREFDTLLKRIDPAYAAQAKFTAGVALLEKGLKAQVISQQQAVNGYRLLQTELETAEKAAVKTSGGFMALGRSFGPAAVAAAILSIGKASLSAAELAEQSLARVEAVLNATGHAAGLTQEELEGLAQSMAKTTRFNDEEIRNGIAVLLSFRQVSGDSFERAIKLAADWAELMNTDLRSATRQLGSALADPVHGLDSLSEAGVRFSDTQKETIKAMIESGNQAGAMNIILTELEGRVGGTAEKLNHGLTKSTREVGKAWHELTEAIGETSFIQKGASAGLDSLTDHLRGIKNVIEDGDWIDRLALLGPLHIVTPSNMFGDNEAEDENARKKRIAEEGRLAAEYNALLERRAELQKKLKEEQSKLETKVLTDQRNGIKEQIQGYKSLRQGMVQAFEEAGRAAQDAREKAQGFLDRASSRRQSAQDRLLNRKIDQIENVDTTGLSEEDAAIVKAKAQDEADLKRSSVVSDALYEASQLRARAIEEFNKNNEKGGQRLLDLSDEQIERAGRFADQLQDERRARSAIEEVADRAAENDEQRAAVEEKKTKVEDARRAAISKKMEENETLLQGLQENLDAVEQRLEKLSNEKATVSVTADQASFDQINAELDKLLEKKRLLASRDPNFTGVIDSKGNAVYRDPGGSPTGLAYGGEIPGMSSHDRADDQWIRATSGEWMMQRPAVRYYGRDFMRALNEMRLPRFGGGYAWGGEISSRSIINRAAMPVMSPGAGLMPGDTINLTMPSGKTFELHANKENSRGLQADVRRAALIHGGLPG
jgi:hypothetical protein